jgi:hypothetical protein
VAPRERHERLDLDEEPVRSGARAHELANSGAKQLSEHLHRVQPVQLDRKTHFFFFFFFFLFFCLVGFFFFLFSFFFFLFSILPKNVFLAHAT